MIQGHVVPAQKEQIGCRVGNAPDGGTKESCVREGPRVKVRDEGDAERRTGWVWESERAAIHVQATL
jgi:hypothetical protein